MNFSNIILDRNSKVFYNIFHVHNFILHTLVLTSLKRKILRETCKVVLDSQVSHASNKFVGRFPYFWE